MTFEVLLAGATRPSTVMLLESGGRLKHSVMSEGDDGRGGLTGA
jgi:hypothetical protein